MKNINTIEYWDKKHSTSFNNRFIPVQQVQYHKFIKNFVTDSGILADIGCGTGLFIEDLLRNTKNLNIVGIDFSDKVITANKNYFKINFPERDVIFVKNSLNSPLNIWEGNYKYVVCMEVLEHITDYNHALSI